MKLVLYAQSVASDWNNGHAHFLRGVLTELQARGHDTLVLEPEDGWSRENLLAEQGAAPLDRFRQAFPSLRIQTYTDDFDHAAVVSDVDAVIVHEWNSPQLIAHIGRLRAVGRFTLLFHDSHHRGVSDQDAIQAMKLDDYDAVLAFGETLRARYERLGWGRRVFTWHEAADTRIFHPRQSEGPRDDVVWVGNWGDGERTQELLDFLVEPARSLGLSGTIHGVRYPPEALRHLQETRLRYGGWIANADVPSAFARHSITVHIPRRPYVNALPGIPTIRVFEALACGIPLICAPWNDAENLFRPGWDYLVARDTVEMRRNMNLLLHDAGLASALAESGLHRIRERHSCAHRADELLAILRALGGRT